MEQQEQRIISGNRCGYDPNVVELFTPPEDQGPRPLYIQEAVRRMGKVFDSPDILPELYYTKNQGKKNPGKQRKRRGERRQSCTRVLQYCMHNMDVMIGEICWPKDDGTTLYYSRGHMLKQTRGKKWRAERALKTLEEINCIRRRRIGSGRNRRTIPVLDEGVQKRTGVYQLRIAGRKQKLDALIKNRKGAEKTRKKEQKKQCKAYLESLSDEEKGKLNAQIEKNRNDALISQQERAEKEREEHAKSVAAYHMHIGSAWDTLKKGSTGLPTGPPS
jgi:hypothetical protein